jgi:hypothetical protein
MNMTQQRFLINRLDEAKRSKPSRYGNVKIPMPPVPLKVERAKHRIQQCKKVIADWETQCDKARSAITDKVESEFHSAKQAILFAETAEAIKAVERFEKMKF